MCAALESRRKARGFHNLRVTRLRVHPLPGFAPLSGKHIMLSAIANVKDSVQRFWLAGGDWGTSQTIAKIRQLVQRAKRDIKNNRLGIELIQNTNQFSETDKARAIFDWVQKNFRFVSMVVGCQTLRSVDEILRVKAGDCTNLNATLLPSLLETVGIQCRLVTIASHPDQPSEFTHVYCEANCDGHWIALDVARPDAMFGRAPEAYYRKRYWDLDSNFHQDVPGNIKPIGLSAYAQRVAGMGDGSNDSMLANALSAGAIGTADIIAAERAAPQNLYGGVTTNPNQPVIAPSAGSSLSTDPLYNWLGIPSSTLILIGGVLLVGALALRGSGGSHRR